MYINKPNRKNVCSSYKEERNERASKGRYNKPNVARTQNEQNVSQ